MKIHKQPEKEKTGISGNQKEKEIGSPVQVHLESISQIFLLLTTIETAVTAVSIFLVPSVGSDQWWGGYSHLRLGIGLGMVCLFFLWLGLTLDAFRMGVCFQKLRDVMVRALDGEKRVTALALFLLAGIFLFIFILLLFSRWFFTPSTEFIRPLYPWLALQMDRMYTIISRFPLVFYGALVWGIQALVWLFLVRRAVFRGWFKSPEFSQKVLVFLAVMGMVVYHWSILLFRLKIFLVIPGWKWYFTVKEGSAWQWLIVPLIFSSLLVTFLVLKFPGHRVRNWLLILALGYSLQVGFGFMEGQGFESLRLKYADSIFNRYAEVASYEPDPRAVLTYYEKLYERDGWLGTKPPGVLLVYVAVQKMAGLVFPARTAGSVSGG